MKRLISFLLLLLLFALRSTAQVHVRVDTVSAGLRTVEVNPIVVTGEGHHVRQRDAVTPVRVITAGEIRDRGPASFEQALPALVPQISMAPNAMGSQIRLNGLSNKYILVLVNGRKLSGDISNNIDLGRIDMARVRRIEVLDGAASALYGSDAIAGVINVITDRPVGELLSATVDTRFSGEGQQREAVSLDVSAGGFSSQTSYTHEQADSYRINPLEYIDDDQTETQESIAPLYTGYRSHFLSERITFDASARLSLNAGIEGYYKKTDRPDTSDEVDGGTSYEMRYKGLRWNVGGLYKFSRRKSVQFDFLVDRFRYGKEYDVATSSYAVGDYVQSKREKNIEADVKAVLDLVRRGTTVFGANYQLFHLMSTSGDVDADVYTFAIYGQHEQQLWHRLKFSAGLRLTKHETAGVHLTPKVALNYSPGRFVLRASYSMGFRSPGLDELYYRYASTYGSKLQVSFGNTDLSPETSHYVSVGAEYNSGRVLSFGVSGYVNRVRDMILKDYVAVDEAAKAKLLSAFPDLTEADVDGLSQYAQYLNADKGKVMGLQANLRLCPTDDIDFTASYSYTYARECTSDVWQTLDRSIKNTLVVTADYHHSWRNYTLNVNLNGRLQSKTYYNSYEDAPGYGLWNLNTTHTITALRGVLLCPSIGIDNLFDHVDRRIDSDLRKYALYSPGRLLTVGLRIKIL